MGIGLLSLAVFAVRVIVWVIVVKRLLMTKGIPERCKKCAMLSAAQAQEIHGTDGDRCWNPAILIMTFGLSKLLNFERGHRLFNQHY